MGPFRERNIYPSFLAKIYNFLLSNKHLSIFCSPSSQFSPFCLMTTHMRGLATRKVILTTHKLISIADFTGAREIRRRLSQMGFRVLPDGLGFFDDLFIFHNIQA